MVWPKTKRQEAKYLLANYPVSARRACSVLGLARSTFDYDEHPRDELELREKLVELSDTHRRFGHPRLFVLLKRNGFKVNHKRSERIYQAMGLQLKKRKRKKLGAGRKSVHTIPYGSREVLGMDFVFDYVESGRRLKVLTLVDEYSKISPGILIDSSIRGIHLGPFLEIVLEKLPKIIRVDQGTEFTSRAFLDWAYKNGIQLEFTRVRKPNQLIESFNSRLRDECLNEHVFFDLEDAQIKIGQWHDRYNNFNPHSSLGMLTPIEFAEKEKTMLCA